MKPFFLIMGALAILNTGYLGYMVNCIRVIRNARNIRGVYEIKHIGKNFKKWWGKSPHTPYTGAVQAYLMDRKIHFVYSLFIYMGLIICTILVIVINALME